MFWSRRVFISLLPIFIVVCLLICFLRIQIYPGFVLFVFILHIFSPVACLFILLTCFDEQKFFDEVHFIIFFPFMANAFFFLRNFATPESQRYCPVFSS